MRYDFNQYVKLKETMEIVHKYAYDIYKLLSDIEYNISGSLSQKRIFAENDIIATIKIIENKKEIMINNIDLYYDICTLLRYPNIKCYDDFNPPCEDGYFYERLPKNFDESLITIYDRVLMRAMLESLSENNNRVTVSLDISVTEKELEIKKELIKFDSEHYFDILHSQCIPTILS